MNFQAILMQPYKKNHKRLRDLLFQLYGHLDGSTSGGNAAGVDVSGKILIILFELNY